jgi:AraC-like DNA-binding protein
MKYLQVSPSAAAAHFIKCYWYLEDETAPGTIQRIVPDGRPELIFNLGEPSQDFSSGRWIAQPQSFFVGQLTGPFLVRSSGRVRVLGVRFQPHGAGQIFRMSALELTGAVIPLDALCPSLAAAMQRLPELRSLSEQFAALDRICNEFAQASPAGYDPRIAHAVRVFQRSGGVSGIAPAARVIGFSPRQLERRFLDAVGISPKLFCRMQRFQSIFQRMDRPDFDWATAALDCGYYDQAHLIRDFREFSGKTPTALFAKDLDLARHFLSFPGVSHFSKTGRADGR